MFSLMKTVGMFRLTSKRALIFSFLIAIFLANVYYPKWKKPLTEATISWDIAGYYIYLPAIFIYHDLKKLGFKKEVYAKYNPFAITYESFTHPKTGNEVLKYSAGMAVMYAPSFLMAHILAKPLGYPADGYSLPYQFALSLGGLLMAFIGLYYLRRSLLLYYDDYVVAWVILLIGLGTNLLEYATMQSPMTHGHIFMLASFLIWFTIRYYRRPSTSTAIPLGIIIGLACLIRPTEFILIVIPTLWNTTNRVEIKKRFAFLKPNGKHIMWAGVAMAMVGSLQIIYWLYVANDPLVYSYQEQGFKFFQPQISNGFFSYRKGWFIYTPVMFFALLGFYLLYKKNRKLFLPLFVYTILHIYITLSWANWWYGGGLGQRALIHAYPALAFALAGLIAYLFKHNKSIFVYLFSALFIYYNIWMTHQAHLGGLLETEAMTKKYFFKILGKYSVPDYSRKYLDTNEEFNGLITNREVLHFNNFDEYPENDQCNNMLPIQGTGSLCILPKIEYTEKIKITDDRISRPWIRMSGDFHTNNKEWNVWQMARLTVEFIKNNESIKSKHIKIQRHIHGLHNVHLFFDTEVPNKGYDEMHVYISNEDSPQSLLIDNLMIEQFE